jgi:prolyl oligopeptidase
MKTLTLHLRFLLIILINLFVMATAEAVAGSAAPIAPVRNVTDQLHGVAVQDPYRYMENVRDSAVQRWMKAQGDVARQALDAIPARMAILKRIEALDALRGDVVGDVTRLANGQLFYLKRAKGERQFKLVMRQSLQAPEQVLVDTTRISQKTGVPHAINHFTPSWDGLHVAYGMSAGGSEDASLYVLNVASGKTLGQPIPRVPEALVVWLPDSQSFTYNQLKKLKKGEPDTEVYMDSKVMWAKLGQAVAKAVPVFGPTVNRTLGLARLDVASLKFQPGSDWMLARTTDTTVPEGFLFAARVADLPKAAAIPWQLISTFDDKVIQAELKGDEAYLLTYSGAPRNRVIKLNLNSANLKTALMKAELSQAPEVATPPPNAVLESFTLSKAAIVASVREGTSIGIRQYPLSTAQGNTTGVSVPIPHPGAAHVHADAAQAFDDILYTLGGWTEPARIWRFDGGKNSELALGAAPQKVATLDVEVTDVLAKSHDGVMVPMTLLHKRGLPRNGNNPTLLRGYGAYGLSETAHYSASDRVWLEHGGVMAYANVRGSGVYGQDWYRGGFKATKPNTWKDGIACAQYLIALGYASPATLAIEGGSAGGIFAGRAITEAPALFAAAVIQVGVMDAVRAELSANGITNISEFGSLNNPAEFPALLEMSAYHQIKDVTAYPAVMFTHGLNDPRVDVWHSAKGAARLQAATASLGTTAKPVLLRLDAQAGHGMGSTSTQRQQLSADVLSFLLWQMGLAR